MAGNLVGLSESELAALADNEREELLAFARQRFREAGAHFVIDQVSELPGIVGQIEHGV